MSTHSRASIDDLRQRVALLSIITDFNLRLSSTLAPSSIERLLFDGIAQATGAQGCTLLNDKQRLRCCVCFPEEGFRVEEGEPPSGCPAVEVLQGKKQIAWSKVEATAEQPPNCRAGADRLNSFIGLPLSAGDEVIGAVGAIYRQTPENIEQHADLLAAMAIPAGLAIHNGLLHQQLSEEKERVTQLEATMHRLFTTYLPQQVADVFLAHPEQAQLGGQRREVTILFCDIQGFTSLSEMRPPEEVVSVLNSFLGIMVEGVFLYSGTLDKFVGDGVMAIFNAPLSQDDHPWRAVQAALAIRDHITDLEAAPVSVNIGLHTGEAVVGSIGNRRLLNYTAIGDTVNVASRLQSMAYGGQILISETVYQQIKGQVQVKFLGKRKVAGRQQPVKVYVVIGSDQQ